MKNNLSIGERYRLEKGLSSVEHELFFDYLLISPSYRMAHEYVMCDGANGDGLIPNWGSVLDTYTLFGDIYSQPFLNWWEEYGQNIFYDQQIDGTFHSQGQRQLINNKVNLRTLFESFALVCDKAQMQFKTSKRVENWRLGVYSGVHSKWAKQLTISAKKTYDNLEARTTLGVLVSKKLKEALYLAENAARGEFPTLKKIETGLEFDLSEVHRLVGTNTRLSFFENTDRKKRGQFVPKTHYEKFVKPKRMRELKIQTEVERQIKQRAAS